MTTSAPERAIPSRAVPPSPAAGGFTLIELVVAMGLLSAFLIMLVQVTSTGVAIFDRGERGQDLADRARAAATATTDALGEMIGPQYETFDAEPPTARLLCTWEALGLDHEDPKVAARTQVVRATVRLAPELETRMLKEAYLGQAMETASGSSDQAIEDRLAEILLDIPLRRRGELVLLPWPADKEGAFLELRRGVYLEDGDIALCDVASLAEAGLTPSSTPNLTEVVATGVLHVDFAWQSQDTRSWARGAGPGAGGPDFVWDSARAGWLSGSKVADENFSLDVGESSWNDSRDDVFPRWVRITLVVARPSEPALALVARETSTSEREIELNRTDKLPDPDETRYLKIGSEWVRYGRVSGSRLEGVVRGVRKTAKREHKVGTKVRAGRTIVLYHRIPHGRDAFDD